MAESDLSNGGESGPWQFVPEPGEKAVQAATQPQQPAPEIMPAATAIPPDGPDGSITWTASEFIAHQKSGGWYAALAVSAAVLTAGIWLITKDILSAAVVVVGGLLLGVYGARQPRQLQYRLDSHGLAIADKHFPYQAFRSFSIVPEGAFNSIVFMPLRRFAALTTIYYAPDDEDKIVALLSGRLPMEARKKDMIDRLMWRIRF